MKLALLGEPTPIVNPLSPAYEIGRLISGVIGALIMIAAATAFIYLIIGGISWLLSGGDKGNIENARNKIIHALLGLVIIASVWAAVNFLFPALGLSFPQIRLPSIGRGLDYLNSLPTPEPTITS